MKDVGMSTCKFSALLFSFVCFNLQSSYNYIASDRNIIIGLHIDLMSSSEAMILAVE